MVAYTLDPKEARLAFLIRRELFSTLTSVVDATRDEVRVYYCRHCRMPLVYPTGHIEPVPTACPPCGDMVDQGLLLNGELIGVCDDYPH